MAESDVTRAEEWRAIPRAPAYQASNLGRIRRAPSEGGRVLRQRRQSSGYMSISLGRCGSERPICAQVHTLVLEAFVGPKPSPHHQAAHWDGNRSNNALDNLRWATAKENAADRDRHGTTAHPKGSAHAMSVLTESTVRALRDERRCGVSVTSLSERYGVSRWTIFDALSGRTWGHV